MKSSLSLKKRIYDIGKIKVAMIAYKDICTFQIKEDENTYLLTIEDSVADVNIIMKEFENYLIGISGAYGY